MSQGRLLNALQHGSSLSFLFLQNPVKYEVFDSLSLNLPLCQPQVSLHSCLLDFIKSEVVADVECTKCSQVCII